MMISNETHHIHLETVCFRSCMLMLTINKPILIVMEIWSGLSAVKTMDMATQIGGLIFLYNPFMSSCDKFTLN